MGIIRSFVTFTVVFDISYSGYKNKVYRFNFKKLMIT